LAHPAPCAERKESSRAAELELFDAPGEEHTLLQPVSVGKGYRFTFGYTVDDLETVKELGR
jgi:hypothetical protein